MDTRSNGCVAEDVEAVITSFNQGTLVLEAVQSLCDQTMQPSRIVIVDDGSTDEDSINILNNIKTMIDTSVPISVIQQPNAGASTARNAGIRETQSPMVLVLDGDDKMEPHYIERFVRVEAA
ncbi:MAG: glycosyltransferase family 2 protein [Roseburia sp.]